jgi:hypothetical protein
VRVGEGSEVGEGIEGRGGVYEGGDVREVLQYRLNIGEMFADNIHPFTC